MTLSPELVQAVGRKKARHLDSQIMSWSRAWGTPSLGREIEIQLNRRLRSTIARYVRDKRTIEVGERFLALRTHNSDVLAHELAHAAVHLLYDKTSRPHGAEWKQLLRAVGFVPHSQLKTGRQPPTKSYALSRIRYIHRCPVCQMVRVSTRPVRAWRCRSCVESGLPGNLEITRTVTSS